MHRDCMNYPTKAAFQSQTTNQGQHKPDPDAHLGHCRNQWCHFSLPCYIDKPRQKKKLEEMKLTKKEHFHKGNMAKNI